MAVAIERDTKGADRLKISEEIAYTCRKANLGPCAFVLQFFGAPEGGRTDAARGWKVIRRALDG
jgi:hypothetical protein